MITLKCMKYMHLEVHSILNKYIYILKKAMTRGRHENENIKANVPLYFKQRSFHFKLVSCNIVFVSRTVLATIFHRLFLVLLFVREDIDIKATCKAYFCVWLGCHGNQKHAFKPRLQEQHATVCSLQVHIFIFTCLKTTHIAMF